MKWVRKKSRQINIGYRLWFTRKEKYRNVVGIMVDN